ncbi:CMP/dCMP deaminase zinc-binding [Chloroherpeton thalassium ATCC 35110]|uniref:tRNA-specific adenosine deaminase n=1 Tax=Chloroherpeton thalassium (strain ATCC 35110 / GB-78) TaxID=517418 RepID=B3QVH3_CHLT3|nr:nucleoside deaminase [Chloroherpeton thalassium]ACF14573.1 CMP/dCMP deaminase zinc-binding [Chloroherpeton thalassium ATCC 35110]
MFLDSHSYTRLMEMAFREAEKAFEKNEVPVGAVVFDSNGAIVGRGFNQVEMLCDTTAHAEMIALTSAMNTLGDKYLTDCTLAVTMEPCPMCAGAMVNAKLGRLIFGSYDAKMGAAGTVFNLTTSKFLNHQMEVIGGILEEKTTEILKSFFAQKRISAKRIG